MKYLLIAIITSIVFIQCSSPGDSIIEHHNNYTRSDLEGNWTLIKVEVIEEKQSIPQYNEAAKPDGIREWTPPVFLGDDEILRPHSPSVYLSIEKSDMDISGDSIFWLNYPLELYQRSFYTIESDLLKIENDQKGRLVLLNSDKDLMQISYLDFYGLYLEKTYQKVRFDDSILNILKLYKINFPLLAGTWNLLREDDLGWGTSYTLRFPYDIPDSLVITEEELRSTLYTDRSYNMLTSGKKRKYFLGYDGSELQLTPGDWYKEGDPYIHLERIIEEENEW